MYTATWRQEIPNAEPRTKDGIILVDKERGPSSFKVVEKIKNLIWVKKAGHAGTLDPFATGLLIVLLNQGTKLSPFLMSQDKVYKAALRLGIETDTQDLTGTIIKEREVAGLTREHIEAKSQRFVGFVTQVPPLYSAVHHKGKRAYELARDNVEFVPRERQVRIDYITILSVDLPSIWIEVGCSSGTYIRTLAADLGKSLGVGAHLTSLRRIRSGSFHVDNSYTVSQIARHLASQRIERAIISLKDALKGMGEVEITDSLARRIRNGHIPQRHELVMEEAPHNNSEGYFMAVKGEELVAVLRESNNGYEISRVFT
jgi:tRNA pseudouridine55 synthase